MTNTNMCSFQTNRDSVVSARERLHVYTRQPRLASFFYLLSFKPHNGVYCAGCAALIAQSRVPPTGDDQLMFPYK